MTIDFPPLAPWQRDVFEPIFKSRPNAEYFVVKSSRQKGKSFLIGVLAIAYAVTHDDTEIMLVSPTAKQSRKLYTQIKKGCRGLRTKCLDTTCEITFQNGAHIFTGSAEQKENLRGYTANLLVIDEAAYISDAVFEILLQVTSKTRANVLLTSTPAFCQGFFHDLYKRGLSGDAHIHGFDWSDTSRYDFSEFISQEQIEFYRKIYSPQRFRSEVLGEFVSDFSFVFGNFLTCICTPSDETIVAAGIDWSSGTNGDSTVVTYMNARSEVVKIWATNTMKPTEQVAEIARQFNSISTLKVALAEKNSIGEVYLDMLRKALTNKSILQEFTTSNDSKREIVEDVIKAIGLGTIGLIDDSELKSQMSYYQMEMTPSGKITYNARDGMHDDYCMSLCFAYRAVKNYVTPPVGTFHYTSKKKRRRIR